MVVVVTITEVWFVIFSFALADVVVMVSAVMAVVSDAVAYVFAVVVVTIVDVAVVIGSHSSSKGNSDRRSNFRYSMKMIAERPRLFLHKNNI